MSTDKQRPLVKSPASFHEAVSEFLPVEAIGREAEKADGQARRRRTGRLPVIELLNSNYSNLNCQHIHLPGISISPLSTD
jgi:hypothetical protein